MSNSISKVFCIYILCLLFSSSIISQEISFLFMGDIMGHGPQIKSAWQENKKKYEYLEVFNPLEDIISSVDFAIANLEVTLAGKPYIGYPQFSSPDELAVACKKSGMDVLVTANNHSCDRKNKGIVRTLNVLDSLKILHTGTFKDIKNREKNNLLVLSKDGIKVGLLNYTYGTNGLPFSDPVYVNLLDSILIKKDVTIAKNKDLDKLVVFVHWGYEYRDFPNSYQKKYNRFFKDLGVDIVIGSHPHVIQPMEYSKKNNEEYLTVYSLGNFVSNQREERKDGGAMFRLTFQKIDNSIRISRKEYIPVWVHKFAKNGKNNYQILPCAKSLYNEKYFSNKEDYLKMKKFLNDSRKHLSANNIKIIEGIPYGLASIRPVKNLKSFPGKIRNVVFKTMKNEKRRKRKK
jgi:poly-gamma-glutamate synthesis protein (capsule biosynthesis protein)